MRPWRAHRKQKFWSEIWVAEICGQSMVGLKGFRCLTQVYFWGERILVTDYWILYPGGSFWNALVHLTLWLAARTLGREMTWSLNDLKVQPPTRLDHGRNFLNMPWKFTKKCWVPTNKYHSLRFFFLVWFVWMTCLLESWSLLIWNFFFAWSWTSMTFILRTCCWRTPTSYSIPFEHWCALCWLVACSQSIARNSCSNDEMDTVVTCLCFGVKFLVTKKLPVVLFWMTITLPLGVLREDGERWREFPVSDWCIWTSPRCLSGPQPCKERTKNGSKKTVW